MKNSISTQQKALIITKILFDKNENMHTTLTDEQKHHVFLQLLNDVSEKLAAEELITEELEGGFGDFFNNVIDWTSKAAEDAANWSKKAAEDAANWSKKATEDAANWTKDAAIDVADWSKQAAVDSYDWGKGAVKWGTCKSCTATIASILGLSGATIALNLLIVNMLNNEPDKNKKNQKINDAIDEVMNHLPKEINGVNIDKAIREKTKAMFLNNLEKNPFEFMKMCKSGIQYVIATIICQVAGLCKD